ncbi:MAG: DUF1573 domain-containing protein [bacterium]
MNPRIFFLFLFLLTGGLFISCGSSLDKNSQESLPADIVNNPNTASGQGDKSTLPVITFVETEHDFGKLLQGENVSYTFKFTNTGKSDLLIAEVSTSCGCTVPSFPKAPVKPGEEGSIKVTFASKGQKGFQSKNVLVVSNTQPNTVVLRIKAQVVSAGGN